MLDPSTFQHIESQYPWFFPLVCFIAGSCVGSFLNVCIYRIPAKESIIRPGSHNSKGDPIAWYDNIPILSWFILRGKDRKTGEAFSLRYAVVELMTGALFAACWLLHDPLQAVIGMVFLSILIPASFIDLDHMILPDVFTVGGACLGVILSAVYPEIHGEVSTGVLLADGVRGAVLSMLGVIVGSAVVLWLMVLGNYLFRKDVMGEGDIFFMGCIGAFCGWQGALFAVFGGAAIGCLVLIPMIFVEKIVGKNVMPGARERQSEDKKNAEEVDLKFGTSVPFGPWLALGGALYYLYAHMRVDAYFNDLAAVLFP